MFSYTYYYAYSQHIIHYTCEPTTTVYIVYSVHSIHRSNILNQVY